MSILEIICFIAAVEILQSMIKKNRARIEELESRIRELEQKSRE